MLFGPDPRTDSSPKLNRENEFTFMNRSARVEIGNVRKLLEQLVAEYPEHERAGLIARVKSENNTNFRSAVGLGNHFGDTLVIKMQSWPKMAN